MRSIFFGLIFSLTAVFVQAQSLNNFFYAKGVRDLSYCAHVSNPFLKGTYDVGDDFVFVTISSYDSVFGRQVTTKLKVGKGFGGLYFNSINTLSDDDFVNAFGAFGLQSYFFLQLAKAVSPKDYDDIKGRMVAYFNINPEKWNGATWALFALNLDYYLYITAPSQ